MLVNTTTQGMVGQPPLAIDLSRLSADAIVVDIVYSPLITPLLADARARVLRTHGVVNFVGVQGVGTPIPDHEIENINTLLASNVKYQERPFLYVGQRVRICGGALDGLEGILTAENSDRSIVISVGLIQRSLSVRVAGYNVEPLQS